MYSLKKMLKRLKTGQKKFEKDNRGAALLYSLIVGTVILAFCLSMLFVCYTLFAQTSRRTKSLQSKILAQSYMDSLKEEFKKDVADSPLQEELANRIKDGKWVAANSESVPDGSDTEIVMSLDTNTLEANSNFMIMTTFSFEANVSGDDSLSLKPIDQDDQDEEEDDAGAADGETGGAGGAGGGAGDGSEDPDPSGSYLVNASVKCTNGAGGGMDEQSYTIDCQFVLNVAE